MTQLSCRFVVLGSGGSCGLPNLRHILQQDYKCKVCEDALRNPSSKNRRGNPSLLVSVMGEDHDSKHLLVDCGKTFEQSARAFFPSLGVHGLKAVVLTHGHADAILGLDGLREVQLAKEHPQTWEMRSVTPLYGSEETLREAWQHFHYMFPPEYFSSDSANGKKGMRRRASEERVVGVFCPRRLRSFKPFYPIDGLRVLPLPVLHGGTYECLGFAFGARGEFVYLSDVSGIPVQTMDVLKTCAMDVLVVDALLKSGPNYSHFGLPQALALVELLRPKRALIIGMSCQFEHERDNCELHKLACAGTELSLSFDGLCINLEVDSVETDELSSSDAEMNGQAKLDPPHCPASMCSSVATLQPTHSAMRGQACFSQCLPRLWGWLRRVWRTFF
eukprot:TRINITY_DN58775_c0_g1_i1.p1 TRINITY_DN58775_c0_g1~~TRINITY_DN58775_c0_g1_i1.p1  ORF type:complete len:389 (+),score=45.54 TRINITY_DN58775_c0_g1_i1:47-1213(+)